MKEKKAYLILSIAFTLLQLIATVVFMVELHTVNVLPVRYKVMIGVILGLFVLITAITQRWKVPGVVTKVLGLLLSAVLIIGCVYINITYSALSKLSGATTKTTTINVYVLEESEAESIADLLDGNFGIMGEVDREYTDEAIAEIEEEYSVTLQLTEYTSIIDLASALYNGEVDAIFLNKSSVGVLTEIDGFGDFESRTRILLSHEKTEEIEISTDDEEDSSLLHCEDDHILALYVSGVDVEGSPAENRNSDVNILCFINKTTHQILLLNTPRDYYLTVDWDGGVPDKLTHAGCKGVDCSVSTLQNFYGVKIDG